MITTVLRLALLSCVLLLPEVAAAQTFRTEYEGATALGLDLRRLGHTRRVLMIGAHPDDESTQILSTLALGEGDDVAYLSLTRGEGGQNGIGPELQEGLGLIRSEELLAARRLDGARQYFTRAYDYGFSKNAEEAFRHWPHDSLLADVVAVIRDFRPDVIVSVFSGTPRDGHGQHQAAGVMAREAFEAAADPTRFPEQISAGLRPHRSERLYQSLWSGGEDATLTLETGRFDPLLGHSHFQAAMASRSRHRSQDMGRPLTPGPQRSRFEVIAGGPPGETASLFAGIDTTLASRARALAGDNGDGDLVAAAIPELESYEAAAARAREAFDPLRPDRLLPPLEDAVVALQRARATLGDSAPDLGFESAWELRQAERALWRAGGLFVDAVVDVETVTPGGDFELELRFWNGGRSTVLLDSLAPVVPIGWRAEARSDVPGEVPAGELVSRRFRVHVPADAEPTEPYFLRAPRAGDLYRWPDTVHAGIPFEPPPARARAVVRTDAGTRIGATADVEYVTVDKRAGEVRRPVRVVPRASVDVEPRLALLPLDDATEPLGFRVRVDAYASDGVTGVVRPELPAGWRAEPAEAPVRAGAGGEAVAEFSLTAPADVRAGSVEVGFSFIADAGDRFDRGFSLIDYPHTRPRALYTPAVTAVRALDVAVPSGLRVGYVAGPGDDVEVGLRHLGIDVRSLNEEELAGGDLSAYDVIVTGIRAYEVRPDLVRHNDRLLDYVRQGGTMIVQYNKYEYTEPGIAPYPVTMARPHDRVTDETAPVTLIEPDHPLFRTPNRIDASDFEGWVQERGLYFLHEWDDAFTPLLEMNDPGEEPLRGGLLIAPYGEGTYVYTGLAFFRQFPVGVPGAYRLFANLLALGDR